MRHRRHRSRLNRTTEHRTALMRNLAAALIEHEIIRTTEPKAKQLRQFVERLITIAKDGLAARDDAGAGLAKRRLAFARLNNKEAVKRLFTDIAPRYTARNGGFTRVVKTAPRMGDGAPMAFIELIDRVPKEPKTHKVGGVKAGKTTA
ncbi:MAG: 50S ribosomal protein L17 [bacterium]|nr:50S ribosomal protein L17 [Candidatus Sumerlaeota bacterium]